MLARTPFMLWLRSSTLYCIPCVPVLPSRYSVIMYMQVGYAL